MGRDPKIPIMPFSSQDQLAPGSAEVYSIGETSREKETMISNKGLISADYTQMELRLLTHLSEEVADARRLFNRAVEEVCTEHAGDVVRLLVHDYPTMPAVLQTDVLLKRDRVIEVRFEKGEVPDGWSFTVKKSPERRRQR